MDYGDFTLTETGPTYVTLGDPAGGEGKGRYRSRSTIRFWSG